MIQTQVLVVKDIPKSEIKNFQDKVIMGIARKTLDFTNTQKHFPYLTGALNDASMGAGVMKLGYAEYGLGTDGTINYAPYVWEMGRDGKNVNWTRKSTIPQWYVGVFEKYRNEILEDAIKNANEGT